jgi:ATP-dependent DNA ligase
VPRLSQLARRRNPAERPLASVLCFVSAGLLEGIVSKRAYASYVPGNRGQWLKVKCLYRDEFVVVGWTDPEGRLPYLGALLLAYTIMTGGWSMPAAPAPASTLCRA